jgi:hypothetical protein
MRSHCSPKKKYSRLPEIAYVVSAYLLTAAIAVAIVLDRARQRYSLSTCLAEVARDIYPLAAIGIIVSFVWVSASVISGVDPIDWVLLIPGFFIEVMLWVVFQ